VLRDPGTASHGVPDNVTVVPIPASGRLRGRRAVLDADPAGWPTLLRPVLTPLIAPWPIRHLDGLAAHLRAQQPDILYAAGPYQNLTALWARDLAGVATRVIGSERIGFPHFQQPVKRTQARWRHLAPLLARMYPRLDALIAVSNGVADELARATGLPREGIAAIYNPVVSPRIAEWAAEPAAHPWLAPARDRPVLLGVGRLAAMKDFPTLLRAFATLRAQRTARLVILGDGLHRPWLTWLIRRYGLTGDVDLPGWAANPYAFYARADQFVLSSRSEGLPNALLEAMACGCPVVSTDCPSGPREILDGGRYGPLVPVGDPTALARAMAQTLDAPPDPATLEARAQDFSMDRSADAHLALFRACLDATAER
jgi:glycosyltransferase involved in cell wall biosynthesis